MGVPERDGAHLVNGPHVLQECEHLAEFVHGGGWNPFGVVSETPAPDTCVDNAPDLQM